MLKIKISNLHDGEHLYEFTFKAKDLESDEIELQGDVIVNVNMYKSVNQFDVKVNLKGKMNLDCDRCLEKYPFDFDSSFEIIYKIDFSPEHELSGVEKDEIKYIHPNTAFIELDNDIRDFILLSVPMKKVPEEINEVCTFCRRKIFDILKTGSEDDINPVWEKLIKIKTK